MTDIGIVGVKRMGGSYLGGLPIVSASPVPPVTGPVKQLNGQINSKTVHGLNASLKGVP